VKIVLDAQDQRPYQGFTARGNAPPTRRLKMEKIIAKLLPLKVETLKEMAQALMVDMRDGTDIVLSAVLNRLEEVMPESEFCQFCVELEG
jgi:hypothetical protein